MTLHLKSRGYPFRPRVLFSSFIVVGVAFPTVYYFRRGHISKSPRGDLFAPPLGSFRPNADGTNSSHKYGTTLPDYLPYYIRSLVDTGNP